MFTAFFHLDILETPCSLFKHYHPSNFHVVCNSKSVLSFIFECVLKLEAIEGGPTKQKIWTFSFYEMYDVLSPKIIIIRLLKYYIYAKSGGSRNLGQSIEVYHYVMLLVGQT